MNKTPVWKYWLLLVLLLVGIFFALPNVFGTDPSVQISSTTPGNALTQTDLSQIQHTLQVAHIPYVSLKLDDKSVLARFNSIDIQQQAQEALKAAYNDHYLIAISLASAAPKWLLNLGVSPMRYGLDLRGGVHLLLQVDVDSVLKRNLDSDVRNIAETLRDQDIRYSGLSLNNQQGITVTFRDDSTMSAGFAALNTSYSNYTWKKVPDQFEVVGVISPQAAMKIKQTTVEQEIETLHRRVNELGVSEATVQQEGVDRIAVDLPGIQDATQAKNILGKTATIEFHLMDTTHDPVAAAQGVPPPDSTLYSYMGHPVLLKNEVVLTGDAITNASAGFDQNGQPAVNISMGGAGESNFYHVTGQNIGKPLAVLYIEVQSHPVVVDGKTTIVYKSVKNIISIATIQSALSSPFQITGLGNTDEAKNLSLLLRAGALVAPVTIIAEQNIGPTMGARNIHLGLLSVGVGLALVVILMLLYYRFFGLIADIALVLNLIFIVAVMSLIGAVLSFPGIAAIVLTLGMAVDANVLIFERIREELRSGVAVQTAIHAGYEKAFATIVDANVTSLIAAIVLFSVGTGAIKGFAITLTIGLITSMITAVAYSRAIVNFVYGGKRLTKISIGIKLEPEKR